jgi:hypothetical protein
MIFTPQPLGDARFTREELVQDKKNCRKFGPCGVGSGAIYLNSFYIERRYYLPLASVTRVFKRIAMSEGGFTGRGMFATLPYLVVEYDNGRQKQCIFKQEEQIDQLLSYLKKTHPEISIYSAQAEQKLLEKQRRIEQKKQRVVSRKAAADIAELEQCCDYLDQNADLSAALSTSARQMRVYERSNPAYKWVALFIVLMGAVSVVYGIYALASHAGFAMYFLLFGLAAIFLFSGAHVLPTAKNNRTYIENRLRQSIEKMEEYISAYPDFPVPACYAHPIVLRRMSEILADGRADSIPESLGVLKQDLKALNSSVAVEQEEYDEVTTIKPMFLVMDYQ